MNLKYSLVENRLTGCPDDYSAQVHPATSLDAEATIARILGRGTSLTRTDILAVWNATNEVVDEGTREGCTFNLPLFNTAFSISGVFDGPLDTFDATRHRLNVNLSKGTVIREAEGNVKLEKTNAQSPMPHIQEVKDSVSGTVNSMLTSGGVVELRGYNLRIVGSDPSCGLWFTNETGQDTPAAVIIDNRPSKIIAMIPSLSSGNYTVKVVTQYMSGGKLLKTPKTFVYPKTLQV